MSPRQSPQCSCCNEDTFYSEKYDAYFCSKCDTWNESKCSDPDCFYCPNRPEKPSQDRIEPWTMATLIRQKLDPIQLSNLVRMFDEGEVRNLFEGTISFNGLIDSDKENFPSLYNGDKDA